VRRVGPPSTWRDPHDLVFFRATSMGSRSFRCCLIEPRVWPVVKAEFPEIKLFANPRLRFRRPGVSDQQLSVTVKHDQGP